jgi:1,4-alpha-glucan branching enzyme
VRSFLLSSALFWVSQYHVDGLRIDGVASMLYLDYSRKPGEWLPNRFGGRENLGALQLLRSLNADLQRLHPDVLCIAEESTAFPQVTVRTAGPPPMTETASGTDGPGPLAGLGFDLKWDMGWMHDTLKYLACDPIYRRYHHNLLTFRMMYAHSENFVLPLSHDEVVHMKGSLYGKMAGDDWQRRANLRLLYALQWASPGKKLLFMGGEMGQVREWDHDGSLDWYLLDQPAHRGVHRFLCDLNALYRKEPALYARDFDEGGFTWLDPDDADLSVLSFLRHGPKPEDTILVVLNFTPVPRSGYQLGVPQAGVWREILNSDATSYGGAGHGNLGELLAAPQPYQRQPYSLSAHLPPLGALFFKRG